MKFKPFIPAAYAVVILFCCHLGSAQNPVTESLLLEISLDTTYENYIESKMALGLELLKNGPESGKAFENLVGTLSKREDICNLPLDALDTIQGGAELKECECSRMKAWANLKTKYPSFVNFSRNDREKIYNYYTTLTHQQGSFIHEVAEILRSNN